MSDLTSAADSKRKSSTRGEQISRAFVVVLAGDRMGEMFPLNEGRTTIGRGLHADVRVNDEGISRAHALVEWVEGQYILSDAGSTNGTFANGNKIAKHILSEGDKIQIGASSILRFTFHDESEDDYQRSLYESALRDRVTGIFNRGYFDNRLESDVAFALRHGKPLSLVLFDIDHFRKIQEQYSNSHTDQMLKEVADLIAGTTRSEDIFARFGGDEFVLICRDVDALRASRAATRVMQIVANAPFNPGNSEIHITVSLGVADLAMLHQPSARALIEAADAALYAAKRGGRNRVELYDPESEPTRLV